MRRAVLASLAALAVASSAAACSSSGADPATPGDPDASAIHPDGGGTPVTPDAGAADSAIVFPEGTTFTPRDCSLTLTYDGAASDVKLAGEFTDWATSPRPMTKSASGFSITLEPGPGLQPGARIGYKLIVDGNWTIDPAGRYRKIVGDQMNSALVMPDCEAGPELRAGELTATAAGDMKVRVTVRASADGAAPTELEASLDGAALPEGAWTIDADEGAVDFAVTGLAKGKHWLRLRAVDGRGREALPVDLPFWVEDEAFSYRDGLLYMFMVDRFANGDETNDAPVGGGVEYDADWHGGDLQGALAVLDSGYFEKLGVRTIWLSPLNEQTDKAQLGDGNQLFSAYHGYWPVKARSVEPRFGGDAALRAFVKKAHEHGLRVLLDLINNQVHEDHEYVKPHGDWFRTACQCGTAGCGWSERPFDCNFQMYLPDINWQSDGAEAQFVDDAVHWIAEYDFDGFRVDAVKHVESNAIYDMRAELSRRFEQGGARVFMVGETAVGEGDQGTFFGEHFSDGFAWIDAYVGPTALDGQFDFPTRHNMADGLVSGDKPMNEIEAAMQKSLTRYKPGNLNVRFLNGHDNPRIASIAAHDPKLGCTWASGCRGADLPPAVYTDPEVYVRLKRALVALYTMPGVPYLYSGDEIAMPGGADPDMRRDMRFAEPELAGVQMAQGGAAPAPLTLQQIDLRDFARKLGAVRTSSRALRRGQRVTLVGDDANLWVYAWQAGPKEVAIVAINRGGAVTGRAMSAGALSLAGVSSFASSLGNGAATLSSGTLTLSLGAGEADIFLAK